MLSKGKRNIRKYFLLERRIKMVKNFKMSVKILTFILVVSVFEVLQNYGADKSTSTKNLDLTVVLSGPDNCSTAPPLTDVEQFFEYLEKKNDLCKNMITVGGQELTPKDPTIDGDKRVCIDSPFRMKEGNCNVLSFGISEDWSFDDSMDKKGCKVFSFDPTIGLADHTRSPNIKFFNRGVGAPYDYEDFPIRIDKYENIIHSIGLLNSDIDYLKMDVEGFETDVFKDVYQSAFYLLKKVKQIGVEIHPGIFSGDILRNHMFHKLWDMFHKLECSGFSHVFVEANRHSENQYTLNGKGRCTCYEMLWIQVQTE